MIRMMSGYIVVISVLTAMKSAVSYDDGIDAFLEPYIAQSGQSITLVCTILERQNGDQLWIKDTDAYSVGCTLRVESINHNISCIENDDRTYRQYNLTILSLDRERYNGTWTCRIQDDNVELEIVVIDRANQPTWQPETPVYVADTINNLTCGTNKSAIPAPVFIWWTASSCGDGGTDHTGVDWRDDDGSFMNTWSYKPNRGDNGMCIWCEIRQHVLRQISNEEIIEIMYPPLAANSSASRTVVLEGHQPVDVSLVCEIAQGGEGNPPKYNFTWSRTQGVIKGRNPNEGNLKFSINRSEVCFDDVYKCTPSNTYGSGSPATINVTVLVAPEYNGQNDGHLIVINTDSFDVPCQYIARPQPSVTWSDFNKDVYCVSIQVNENVTDTQGNTSISRPLLTRSHMNLTWGTEDVHVRKHGSGRVTCSADNGVGFPENHTLDIEVLYIPESPSLRFNESVVYAGMIAELTCVFTPGPNGSDGNPLVTQYTWLFESRMLPVDTEGNQVNMSVGSVQQEGNYTCYGTNYPLGVRNNGSESDPTTLTVNVSPYLVEPQENDTLVILYDDSDTAMHCLGAGKPEIDFTWYMNEMKVSDVDFLIQKEHVEGDYSYDLRDGWRSLLGRNVAGVHFTCDNITKYDGLYQCEAYHPGRVSIRSPAIQLITQYPAHWAGPALHPTYYTSPGDNFTLLCNVCMEPWGNITWYLNGEPVRDNVSITDDGRNLTLTDVQLEDFGNYTCQVSNIILDENYTESFDTTLVELEAPHTPLAFQVDGSTSRSLSVSWMPGSTGGYDSQTFTLCYVAHDVHPSCQVGIKDPGDGNLIRKSLRDLEVNTTYQLQLYAENAHHGDNRSSLTALNHYTKVAPAIKVLSLTLSATRVTVTWVVEAGEPSHLTLVHCPAEDCDVTTQRSRRDVKPTWRELATNIPPDVRTYTYEAEEGEPFDVYSHNIFNLWAYELGLNDRSNPDDNASWYVPPRPSDGVDIGLAVGIVVALVAVAALATGGFVYYRKKGTKDGDDHSVKRPNYSDNNKSFRDDQVVYEDINERPCDHSVSSASSAPKEYGTYEDVTSMSIMATSRQQRAVLDEAVCIDVAVKLPLDEVDDDGSYMGLHHHDNNDNNAYEELQVTETMS